jgi:hypothetical protein
MHALDKKLQQGTTGMLSMRKKPSDERHVAREDLEPTIGSEVGVGGKKLRDCGGEGVCARWRSYLEPRFSIILGNEVV